MTNRRVGYAGRDAIPFPPPNVRRSAAPPTGATEMPQDAFIIIKDETAYELRPGADLVRLPRGLARQWTAWEISGHTYVRAGSNFVSHRATRSQIVEMVLD